MRAVAILVAPTPSNRKRCATSYSTKRLPKETQARARASPGIKGRIRSRLSPQVSPASVGAQHPGQSQRAMAAGIRSALAERERRIIGERTKLALQAAKARGVKLDGRNAQSDRNAAEADKRAEQLRPILAELSAMSANKAAIELNRRGVPTPRGGQWHALTVMRLLSFPKITSVRIRAVQQNQRMIQRDARGPDF